MLCLAILGANTPTHPDSIMPLKQYSTPHSCLVCFMTSSWLRFPILPVDLIHCAAPDCSANIVVYVMYYRSSI